MVGEKAADVILADAKRASHLSGFNGIEEDASHGPRRSPALKMTQAQLDELFTKSAPGEIPNGEAEGTAIIAPGTPFTPEIAAFINHFAWQGKIFDAKKGVLKNKILAFGLQRHHRQGLQGAELARRQGVHRARLLGDLATSPTGSATRSGRSSRASTWARSTGTRSA